jgi:phosphatidylserine decarboxylase
MASSDSNTHLEAPSPHPPRLKRLATKPLKLAQSTLHSLSRSSSPHPTPHNNSSTTLLPEPSNPELDPPTRPSRKKRFRRHVHLPGKRDSSNLTPAQVASAARGPRKPLDEEEPAAVLRVRVVRAEGLVAKDRGGTSDP